MPEAAFFARTYAPAQMSRIVGLWRAELALKNEKAASAIADPAEFPNLFEKLELALKAEAWCAANRPQEQPASAYPQHEASGALDVLEHVSQLLADGGGVAEPAEPAVSSPVRSPPPPAQSEAVDDAAGEVVAEEEAEEERAAAEAAAVGAAAADAHTAAAAQEHVAPPPEPAAAEPAPPPPAPPADVVADTPAPLGDDDVDLDAELAAATVRAARGGGAPRRASHS